MLQNKRKVTADQLDYGAEEARLAQRLDEVKRLRKQEEKERQKKKEMLAKSTTVNTTALQPSIST